MPKKRNTSWCRNKKKQIITARLIEISMKVEDCVYKHKPISVCEAEQYIREVSSYKTQCSQDERSLQVIEKLTRCMKSIILGHQELKADNQSIINGGSKADLARAGSVSPVYSIPDDDKTQFTQTTEAGAVNVTETKKDVEIIDLCNIDDDDDLMHNGSNTTTADYTNSRITVEVDIHRAMSSLSLKNVEDKTFTEVNCSQSILKHFEVIDEFQQNDLVSQEAVNGELVGKAADKDKKFMESGEKNVYIASAHDNTADLVIKPNQILNTNSATITAASIIVLSSKKNFENKTVNKPLEVANTDKYGLADTYQKDNSNTSKKFYPATDNISEGQRQTWYDSNKACTINNFSHSLKATQPITIKNAENLSINATNTSKVENGNPLSNVIQTSKALNNNTTIANEKSTKKKRNPRKKKVIDENEIKPKNKRVNQILNKNKRKLPTVKNKNVPIYNDNVINDLSWVENIRYVREIGIDENDPKLNLEDSFWDNYYLPANWSENEFV